MTEFESKIYQIITSKNGIKAAEIAAILDIDKRVVNSTLYSSEVLKGLVEQRDGYKWYSINRHFGSNEDPSQKESDEDLRNICNYYLNCISAESNNAVSRFLTSRFDLEYAVLNGLGIDSLKDQDAINLINRTQRDRGKSTYIGYPVRIFSFYDKKGTEYRKIAPVFLFPIEYNAGNINVSWIPNINIEVIKAFSYNSNEGVCRELINLETELGMNETNSEVEVDELVLRLKQIRDWDWKEDIDPYNIPQAENLGTFSNGIYNRPVVISADKEVYTQGLVSELTALSRMPESSYKGTALYSWIKNEYGHSHNGEVKPLLEVLPLNTEQAQAVETALRSNLTIVTGPPGTGKSQVVTDLLINIAWNGKSALFSSKNNKAVDVVDSRVNGLSRRPILLRIGANQYAPRLAEIIEGLLDSRPTSAEQSETDLYLNEYNKIGDNNKKLYAEKDRIINQRNKLDDLEQAYCIVRDRVSSYFDSLQQSDVGQLQYAAELYRNTYLHAQREKQSMFVKLLWPFFSKKRIETCKSVSDSFNQLASKYDLPKAEIGLDENAVNKIVEEATSLDNNLAVALSYKQALLDFDTMEPLENIDKLLANNKVALATVAEKLWDKWLVSQTIHFSASDRMEMSNFIAAMKLTGNVDGALNSEMKRQYANLSKRMTKYLQCWAVTSLSAKSRVPFEAGVFDYVIIDEASQCDIASIIPLLYRAKRAVIIGDPKQLSHISQLPREQDMALLGKFNVQPAWSYSSNSLYNLASGKVEAKDIVQLRDHFRSHADIIEFSNEFYYEGNLRTATKYDKLKTPVGDKPGIRWINVTGHTVRPYSGSAFNNEEVQTIVDELKRLVGSGYVGTIGVTTPFREQADRIKAKLEKENPETYLKLLKNHEFIADTVHKFQGDERDLMIFSAVVSNGTPAPTAGFLSSTGNLFNVAITRARAVLVVVGDYAYCSTCDVKHLRSFAEYYSKLNHGKENEEDHYNNTPNSREYPWVENPELVSDWERQLYSALYDAGIYTIPQYPVERYKLDLAIIQKNGRKLDIEVDGEQYHRNWNGELSYRDQIRNQRMFELGWDVKRFWVYQIRDQMNTCVEEIVKWAKRE